MTSPIPPSACQGSLAWNGRAYCDHCAERLDADTAGVGPADETLCADCLEAAWEERRLEALAEACDAQADALDLPELTAPAVVEECLLTREALASEAERYREDAERLRAS